MKRLAVAAATAALVLATASPAAPAQAPPVTRGYEYASDCPAAGYADAVDEWDMYECNCTSYVAWALARNSQEIDWFVPGGMDARDWPRVARSHGIPVGSTPRLGAVAVWPHASPPYGHLAYVDSVSPDGRFSVSEYNLLRRYGFDRRERLRANGVVFVYPPYGRGSG